MRKLLLLAAIAALGTMLVATSAASAGSPSFPTHFTLRGHHFKLKNVSKHRIEFKVTLKKRGGRVGNARGKCHDVNSTQAKCHIRYHLNGNFAGRGNIHAVGRFGKGRERFNVTGGSRDFNGVAGKVILKGNRSHFHLIA